jgi:hypothetical protein
VGLWVQNVGVKAPSLPPAVSARAAAESFDTPDQMDGWTWTSLDDGTFLDLEELDAIATEAAGEAGAPSLAYSVHDSDSVYVVGADGSGVRFRLMVNPEAWEDELPPQDVDGAVAWASDHGALDPSREDIDAVLARTFVFAEEGLDVLFSCMGLLPAGAAEGAQELDVSVVEQASADVWNWLQSVPAPEERFLERGRWHATLQHGDLSGHLIAAEEEMETAYIDERLERTLIPATLISGFVARAKQPIVFLGAMPTREELSTVLVRQSVTLGSWQGVPEDVPRDLASTAAWVLSLG